MFNFESPRTKALHQNRTFFCSELVAKAYKHLGIIENDNRSCSQFYPGHFEKSGESFLKLLPGASMNNE